MWLCSSRLVSVDLWKENLKLNTVVAIAILVVLLVVTDIKAFCWSNNEGNFFLEVADVEKKGKDNAGFKNSTTAVDQISTVNNEKSQAEEEKVDDNTVAQNDGRTDEGTIKWRVTITGFEDPN